MATVVFPGGYGVFGLASAGCVSHPDNFVPLTAIALAHTVGGLVDGTIDRPGTHWMDEVVALDAALERAYRELLPVVGANEPVFRRRREQP